MLLLIAALNEPLTIASQPALALSALRDDDEPNRRDADEGAIRKTITAFNNARNAFDAKAIADLFDLDGTFTTPVGTSYLGRQAIQQFFASAFASPEMRSSPSTRAIQRIRFLRPDVALVDVREELGTASTAVRVLEITILIKRSGDWRIASIYHTHLIEPSGTQGG